MSDSFEISAEFYSPDVVDFFRALDRHRVRYVIVGGEAVIFHGYPRLTGDIDFFFELGADNCVRLFAALTEFWGGQIPGLGASVELEEPGLILQFGRPPNRIDLLNQIDGVCFSQAWEGRLKVVIRAEKEAVVAWYVGRQELLMNKQASGRPKDLDDLDHLEGGE